jgi:hypothetical protein
MAGDWIKMRCDLPNEPEVLSVADQCGMDVDTVVGKLHRIWSWADRHTKNGNAVGVTGVRIDELARANGFAAALEKVGWLVVSETGVRIPHFDRHMGQGGKRRALTARRMVTHRKRNSNAKSVTKASPEKRREEKSSNSPNGELKPPTPFPPKLDFEPFRMKWAEWLAFRRRRRWSVAADWQEKQLAMLANHGPTIAIEAIDLSMTNNWQAVVPEKVKHGRQRTLPVGPGQVHDPAAASTPGFGQW